MDCRRERLKAGGSQWSSQGVVRALTRVSTVKNTYEDQGNERGQMTREDALNSDGGARRRASWVDG